MIPDYRRDNPYQVLLAKALEGLGAAVSFPRGYRRVFPLRRMLGQDGPHPNILHLHWLAPYLKGRSAATKAVYAVKFVLDLLLVRRAGVRLVWTVHNLIGHEQMHPRIEVWCRRRLARLADAIIVHSDQARDLVAESYDAQAAKISVIPHGHYRDAYGPPIRSAVARAKLGLPQEGRVFLFFGMVRPYKGVLKLLSTWAGTPELHEQHTLLIAGEAQDPNYMEIVHRSATKMRNVHVRLERIPDLEVPDYFSAADVVVAPFDQILTSGSILLAHSYSKFLVRPNIAAIDAPALEKATIAYRHEHTRGLEKALLMAAKQMAKNGTELQRVTLTGWREVAMLHSKAMDIK
jgi:glycosyltransferase involved in cell wall biosynthesis